MLVVLLTSTGRAPAAALGGQHRTGTDRAGAQAAGRKHRARSLAARRDAEALPIRPTRRRLGYSLRSDRRTLPPARRHWPSAVIVHRQARPGAPPSPPSSFRPQPPTFFRHTRPHALAKSHDPIKPGPDASTTTTTVCSMPPPSSQGAAQLLSDACSKRRLTEGSCRSDGHPDAQPQLRRCSTACGQLITAVAKLRRQTMQARNPYFTANEGT